MKSNVMRFFEQCEQFEQELMQCMLSFCVAKIQNS